VRRLLVTAIVVPSSPILVTLMEEALSSSETSVLTRATRRNIPEDGIVHSHRRENLKSYTTKGKFNIYGRDCSKQSTFAEHISLTYAVEAPYRECIRSGFLVQMWLFLLVLGTFIFLVHAYTEFVGVNTRHVKIIL
jgi:hypothetical protein